MAETRRNIFVLGLDDFNRYELQSIREAEYCNFHRLLDYTEIVKPISGSYDFEILRQKAEQQLAEFDGSIDGIVAFWDFPSSSMAGVLRNAHKLPGPSNEAIARCEHKYWSRLEQREVVPDLIPDFCAVDPFADDPLAQVTIDFPFWIKPVKAHSSRLGFRIRNAAELKLHLPEIRQGIGFFGYPFDAYLQHVDVPEGVRPITGNWCIAEGMISAGQQCTLEGYVYGGEVVIYGIVDSIRTGRLRTSFGRYQYPSQLPRNVQHRMIEAAGRVMRRFEYDCGAFNMEFYWDRKTNKIRLLEINARISKSHCPLFRMVDGASNQEVLIDLALGREPQFPHRQGHFAIAAKFMHRVFDDGYVKAVPSDAEIAAINQAYPEARMLTLVEPGDRLRDSHHRDSYSFELADIFIGGRDRKDLLTRFGDILDRVTFDIEPVHQHAA